MLQKECTCIRKKSFARKIIHPAENNFGVKKKSFKYSVLKVVTEIALYGANMSLELIEPKVVFVTE